MCAVVVLRSGTEASEQAADEIKAWVRQHLAGYNTPRTVQFRRRAAPQRRRKDPEAPPARDLRLYVRPSAPLRLKRTTDDPPCPPPA